MWFEATKLGSPYMKMAKFVFSCTFALCLAYLGTVQGEEWDYDEDGAHGPDHWADDYPKCDDDHQSPINIIKANAEEDDHLIDFHFEHWDTEGVSMDLENDGHTAKLTLTGAELKIDASLPEDYVFDQLHFHWGHDDSVGSEHQIDGHDYPLELHLVHHNEEFDSLASAVEQDNGLAVLGFMFEISDDDNHDLDHLIEALDDIVNVDEHASITTFSLEHLIHDAATGPYFRYAGSLTTPGCYESVIWTVFERTLKISSSQLDHFRHLHDDNDDDITDNHRPVQDLNDRHVYYHSVSHDGAASVAMSFGMVAMVAVLAILF